MRRRALLVLVMATVAVLARGPDAWACSCGPDVIRHEPATVKKELKASHAVFTGMAASVVPEDDVLNVTFAVRDVFKGSVAESYVVASPPLTKDCGIDFVEGRLYDVFVMLEKKVPSTRFCTGTDVSGHVARAGIPIRYSYDLAGNTIGDAGSADEGDDPRGARTGAIAAAALLLALIGAYYVARARARRRTGRRTGLPR